MKLSFSSDTQFAPCETEAWRCPCCNSGVHRVSRRTLDRIWSWLVPSWRYRCRDRQCGWEGRVALSRLSERQRHAHERNPYRHRSSELPRRARLGQLARGWH
jgi:hypothetical protein